jgi:hypothetical protein
MAGAEYVKHVTGDKLKKGDVLVFQDFYTVLGRRTGYVEHTDRYSGEKTRAKVTFNVERFRRDGTGKVTTSESFNLAVSFPLGRLV